MADAPQAPFRIKVEVSMEVQMSPMIDCLFQRLRRLLTILFQTETTVCSNVHFMMKRKTLL